MSTFDELPASELERDFEEYDKANPKIWSLFVNFAMQGIRAGRRRLSARLIIERIRWETTIETNSVDDLKINDHNIPYYARKFARAYPEHDKLFKTRTVRGDKFRHGLLTV